MNNMVTPEAIFKYAVNFAKRAEKAGKGTQFPTLRQVANRFKVKLQDVEDAIEDWQGEGYMCAAVGIQTGNSYGFFDHRGQYLVEAYDD